MGPISFYSYNFLTYQSLWNHVKEKYEISNEVSENAILQENRGLRALPWPDHRRPHLRHGNGGRHVVRQLCFRHYLHRRPDLSQYHLGVLMHDCSAQRRYFYEKFMRSSVLNLVSMHFSQLRPCQPLHRGELRRRPRGRAPHREGQLEVVPLHADERRRRRRQGDPESHHCLGLRKAFLQLSQYVTRSSIM